MKLRVSLKVINGSDSIIKPVPVFEKTKSRTHLHTFDVLRDVILHSHFAGR